MRLTGSADHQTVNRHRVNASQERSDSKGTLPLRSKNRTFTSTTHMALRENDNSRLHYVEAVVNGADKNVSAAEYTITNYFGGNETAQNQQTQGRE